MALSPNDPRFQGANPTRAADTAAAEAITGEPSYRPGMQTPVSSAIGNYNKTAPNPVTVASPLADPSRSPTTWTEEETAAAEAQVSGLTSSGRGLWGKALQIMHQKVLEAKEAQNLQKQKQAEERRAEIENLRNARKAMREERIAKAQIVNAAASSGAQGSSAVAGGAASIGTQGASNLAYLGQTSAIAKQMTEYNFELNQIQNKLQEMGIERDRADANSRARKQRTQQNAQMAFTVIGMMV